MLIKLDRWIDVPKGFLFLTIRKGGAMFVAVDVDRKFYLIK